jgi:predicted O-methyltransferase YrrM
MSWAEVDHYIADKLIGEDPALDAALAANKAAGLPPIDVSPPQGKMLHLLVRLTNTRRIVEVGTLGGYSTIWMARALPPGGRLVTLEIDPRTAGVARSNIERAGVADRVEIVVAPARDTLERMIADGAEPFDLFFIDADKESNADYLRLAVRLARPGALIIVDNVVRDGRVIDPDSGNSMVEGTRRLYDALAATPGVSATAIQTVGLKGWDGFILARVDDS